MLMGFLALRESRRRFPTRFPEPGTLDFFRRDFYYKGFCSFAGLSSCNPPPLITPEPAHKQWPRVCAYSGLKNTARIKVG